MRFGVHVSIAGGLHKGLLRAVELGCDTAQFFLVNPRGWRSKPLEGDEIERFLEVRNEAAKGVRPLVAHMPYLPNLASSDDEIFAKSVAALRDNLERCEALKIDFLVLHMGKGDLEKGVDRMRDGIVWAFEERNFSTNLLLENTAGQGREFGSQVSEISMVYDKIPDGIAKGVCLDVCHAFAAGYDVSKKEGILSLIRETEQGFGLSEVKLIHINDALKPLGSRVDRHAKVGEGFIGKEGFRAIFSTRRIRPLPCILEVPQESEEESICQLRLVRELSEKRRK